MSAIKIKAEDRTKRSGIKIIPGTYVGVVMNNQDPTYAGRLEVWISSFGGAPSDQLTWKTVSYASSFYGISPYAGNKTIINDSSGSDSVKVVNQNQNSSQQHQDQIKSFGMWVQPPAVGTKVLVTFTTGDDSRGFWFAAIPEIAHGMIPAIAKDPTVGKPALEFDPSVADTLNTSDLHKVKRNEYTDETKKFQTQGIDQDNNRGFITSSSFRESPSQVMGFSTPGGHTLVLDDGDANGKSKLIRLRTISGNQITMNDDTGMIYMINAQGTGWLELSPSGYLDVYGQAGINLATNKDINLHADNDVNIHAGNNLKLVGLKGAKLQGSEELQLHGKKTMIEGVDSLQLHSCTEIIVTSYKNIYMKAFQYFILQGQCFRWNSGSAKESEQVPPEKPTTVSGYNTTVHRAPSHEPYKEHDNGSSSGGSGALGNAASVGAAGGTPLSNATSVGAAGGTSSASPLNPTVTPFDVGHPISAVGAAGGTSSASPLNPTVTPFDVGHPISAVGASTAGTSSSPSGIPGLSSVAGSLMSKLTSSLPTTSVGGSMNQSQFTDILKGATQVAGGSPVLSNPLTSASGLLSSATKGLGPIQQIAGSALSKISSVMPANNVPATAGGGASGFATGDNCARPAGGGPNGNGNGQGSNQQGNAAGGQKNYNPPESLKNDPAFQAKMKQMEAKYPGLTDQQIYNVIGGESSYNFKAVNGSTGAVGAFQFTPQTAAGLGYSTAQIQNMSPAEQLGVYDQYLSANHYGGGPLGIMQAAPAFANAPANTVVYPVGSPAWNANPGWRSLDGPITVQSINTYYGY